MSTVKNSISVLGLGTVLVDQQMFVKQYPGHNTKNELENHRIQVGGPVPTALVFLSRLGLPCSFIGKWADDHFGSFIEKDLQKEGVILDKSIIATGKASGFANVWVDTNTGGRTILFTRGTFPPISISEREHVSLQEYTVLHLDGWSGEAAIKTAQAIKQQGGTVFLDAGSPKPGLKDLLPLVDVMICPDHFTDDYFHTKNTRDAVTQLLANGIHKVIVTHGIDGAELYMDEMHLKQAAFPVQAIDTTGAGDVFCGGLIYAMSMGYSDKKALQFASAAAALKCTKVGNREALPDLTEIEKLMRNG
ncbi:MAG: carbohydrate kinase family protein [Fibrobacteria bacterium]|nr:carbohydrate kinase family protein [Fibrobacteria bacterium]